MWTVKWDEEGKCRESGLTYWILHRCSFLFTMASDKLFKTTRHVVTGAHLVKGLWLQYHVAGFCCQWCLKWSTFRPRPPFPLPRSGPLSIFKHVSLFVVAQVVMTMLQLHAGFHACNLSLEIMVTCEFCSGALPLVLRAWRRFRGDRVIRASAKLDLQMKDNLKVLESPTS